MTLGGDDRLILVHYFEADDDTTPGNFTTVDVTFTARADLATAIGLDARWKLTTGPNGAGDTAISSTTATMAASDQHSVQQFALLPVAGGSPQTVNPAGRTSSSTYGAVTAVAGNVNVSVSGRSSVSSYGSISVLTGNVNVSVAGRTSASSFGTVTASSTGPQTVAITGRTSISSFGAITVQAGGVSVAVSGRTSVSSFGAITPVVGGVSVSVAGHTSSSSFGSVSSSGSGAAISHIFRTLLGVG